MEMPVSCMYEENEALMKEGNALASQISHIQCMNEHKWMRKKAKNWSGGEQWRRTRDIKRAVFVLQSSKPFLNCWQLTVVVAIFGKIVSSVFHALLLYFCAWAGANCRIVVDRVPACLVDNIPIHLLTLCPPMSIDIRRHRFSIPPFCQTAVTPIRCDHINVNVGAFCLYGMYATLIWLWKCLSVTFRRFECLLSVCLYYVFVGHKVRQVFSLDMLCYCLQQR